MELHEAILHLKKYQGYIPFNDEQNRVAAFVERVVLQAPT